MLPRRACALIPVVVTVLALAATPASAADRHTVRRGETLSTIAARYGVTVGAIARANNLADPNHVVIGSRLTIPSGRSTSTTPASPRSAGSGASGGSASGSSRASGASTPQQHTVAAGDTLTGIAARYGVSLAALVAANAVQNPNDVPIGTVLQLPGTPAPARRDEIAGYDRLAPLFRSAAAEAGVDPALLMALAFTESRWRQDKVSRSGAIGVGQLLPDTAAWLADRMGEPDLDPTRVEDNVRLSAQLLRVLLDDSGGDPRRALASYFQGPGAVARSGVSPGGARYATLILGRRAWFTSM